MGIVEFLAVTVGFIINSVNDNFLQLIFRYTEFSLYIYICFTWYFCFFGKGFKWYYFVVQKISLKAMI